MKRAERLWSGTERLEALEYAFQLRFGDPKQMLDSDEFKTTNPRQQMYYRPRADPTEATINRFMAFLQDLYRRINQEGHTQASVTCPACNHAFTVDVAGEQRLGES